jgi:hypothetical protein
MINEIKTFNNQALPISYSVFGRRTNKNRRVEYLRDPKGRPEGGYAIPEQVVLSRWRRKRSRKVAFYGMRLSPNIWRSIRIALGDDVSMIVKMSIGEIEQRYQNAATELKRLRYPKSNGIRILCIKACLGTENLKALLDRHNDPSRVNIYGTPDLLLWESNRKTKAIESMRFVEVKKPKEPLSKDQQDELSYLNNELGIPALLLRLIEHKMTQRLNL